ALFDDALAQRQQEHGIGDGGGAEVIRGWAHGPSVDPCLGLMGPVRDRPVRARAVRAGPVGTSPVGTSPVGTSPVGASPVGAEPGARVSGVRPPGWALWRGG